MPKLTPAQISQKLQEGRNYKLLYRDLKVKYDEVKAENKELQQLVAAQQLQLETQAIQIAELQTMVFGKKKRPPLGGTPLASDLLASTKQPRSKASYRRPIPPATAITAEVAVPLSASCACGGSFGTRTTHERYVEDIPLPDLTPNYQAHLVTKYVVTRAVCIACGKATSGRELGGAKVSLGPNVRLLVTHLVAGVGMSYSGVAQLLLGLYGLTVSDGEIANILARQHQAWLPAYETLKTEIRGSPAKHYDETPWAIQAADNSGYAWAMSASASPKTVFHLATSRGTRHARDLHGDSSRTSVHITDDYGVYRNLSGQQQLCWVHLYRGIRDLRHNPNLPAEQLPYVTWWYEQFAAIYQDLRMYLDEPYDATTRETQATELWHRLQLLLPVKSCEPEKLARLKAQLQRAGKDRLLICLPKNTPCDNNRAERDLRQLVLKRKRSFGSKTERGAQALSTVLSICTTAWRENPNNYFSTLAALA